MIKNNLLRLLLLACLLILLTPLVLSQRTSLDSSIDEFDQIVINSQNWQDIFQGLLYAKLVGVPGDFLIVQEVAVSFVASLDKSLNRVLYIEPARSQQYQGLRRLIEREGFTIVEVPGSGSFGLRLAQTISPEGIIVTDERYPYNAVSLAPYAISRNEFVLFADASTVDEVENYISQSDVPLTLFGLIDSTVSTRFSQYSPNVIDKGGKFENNIYLANEFLKINPGQQVVVTNGAFIENGLIDDFNANVFVGESNVPLVVEDFFIDNDIIVSVLVGNYLSDQMSFFKTSLEKKYDHEMQVFVRFAKTPRQVDAQFNEPQSLEFFSLPILLPGLDVDSFTYNRLSKNLEVTYVNPSLIQAFFTSSIILELEDGSSITIGDDIPQSIVAGQSRTVLYPLDNVPNSAQGLFLFGDYPISQEFSLSKSFDSIPVVDIDDNSKLVIEAIVYDKRDKAFYITVTNPSDILTYAQIELVDVIIDGLPQTIGTKDVFDIAPGESKTVFIRAELQNLDIVENELVLVRGNYGERKLILFNQVEDELTLSVRLISQGYIIAGVAVLVIILLVLLVLFTKKSTYVCDRCGNEKHSRTAPRRHTCGGKFKKH